MTIKNRRTVSTIERSPKPDLKEVREYFYHSFTDFLDRNYKANLEAFLTELDNFTTAHSFEEQRASGALIIERFLSAKSTEQIHFHPEHVRDCKATFMSSLQSRELPADLFKPFELIVTDKLVVLIDEYFTSDHFYSAAAQPNGYLWRVLKMSRLSYSVTEQMMRDVINPFLDLYEKDALATVPHYSLTSREALGKEFVRFQGYMEDLKNKLRVIAYMAKQNSQRDQQKVKRGAHKSAITNSTSVRGGDKKR